MLLLHSADVDGANEVLVSPDIGSIRPSSFGEGSEIGVGLVVESPLDIARLKAAWEQRFDASELRGTLPIAVRFDPDGDGGRGAIMFLCCKHTKRLHDERVAARQRLKAETLEKRRLSRRNFLRGFWRG